MKDRNYLSALKWIKYISKIMGLKLNPDSNKIVCMYLLECDLIFKMYVSELKDVIKEKIGILHSLIILQKLQITHINEIFPLDYQTT